MKRNTAAATPEAQIEQWPLDRLIPYARNPRKNDHAVGQMVSAIKEFGFKVPILARSDGAVIDGHLRLKAAHFLKLERVPVLLCDEWSEGQVKAFRLLANRSVTWAEWDEELIATELEELMGLDFDLSLTGFSESEVNLYFDGPQFSPASEDEQGSLDELKQITCPSCGHEFRN
jgi:ParB-like chromosome segregation protein Spo0J